MPNCSPSCSLIAAPIAGAASSRLAFPCSLGARIERPLILDLGANIGHMSLYFAKNWPKAHIIAVEPDEGNFRLLKANIEGLSNITPIEGAVASENGAVEIANPHDEA